MPIAIGTQLGSYEITGLLGKGGMGEVFRARESALGSGGRWSVSRGAFPVWARNGRELFWQGSPPNFNLIAAGYTTRGDAFVAGKPRIWSDKQRITLGNTQDFDVAPDGKRLVVIVDAEAGDTKSDAKLSTAAVTTHVNLLLNFFDEVRRRAPAGAR